MTEARIQEFFDSTPGQPGVRGFLHLPAKQSRDVLILTHGAGSNCRAPLLVALAEAFCAEGTVVLRCDLPFRQLRPQGPPVRGSAERDQEGLRRAIEVMSSRTPGRVLLGGHSYGGRQASILASTSPGLVHGLLLLSYPLHPPRRPAELRTSHFPALQTPSLFVVGSRDGFATFDELTTAVELIPARTEVIQVEGSGHELLTKRNCNELPREVVKAFQAFLSR